MNIMKPLQIGSIVLSKAGRDHSNYFLVVEISSGTVKVVDGKLRRITNPKKKNLKHLVNTGETLEGLSEKLKAGKTVYDAEIYSALRKYRMQKGGINV